jgi:predicted N-acetyltransferase YhbS
MQSAPNNDSFEAEKEAMMFTMRSLDSFNDHVSAHDVVSSTFGTPPAAEERDAATREWIAHREAKSQISSTMIRGAFQEEMCIGCYQLDLRQMRLGDVALSVGCIGAVATHPNYRKRGVAASMMRDATEYAKHQGIALLLLHGISNFYHRYGYANVADAIVHQISLETIKALPTSTLTVRPADADDVDALLALYIRHHNRFVRSREVQKHQLRQQTRLAVDSMGRACGYLILHASGDQSRAVEVAADSWQAAVALLQAHAELLERAPQPCAQLRWPLPLDGTTYYLLAEHIRLTSEVVSIPNAEWMARPGSLPALIDALASQWKRRLRQQHAGCAFTLRQAVGDSVLTLSFDGEALSVATSDEGKEKADIVLSLPIFMKLLVGYRPIDWAMHQPEQHIPLEWLPVLQILYPTGRLWVPGTDEF